jgi:glucokinase
VTANTVHSTLTLGVDLGGTNIRAGIEVDGRIVEQKRSRFHARGTLTDTLSEFIDAIRPLVLPGVTSIGVGVPSVVDVEHGMVLNVVNIPSWEKVPLRDILEVAFGLPVYINNDVNCFILGEHRYGWVKGMKNVVGVSCGTGLGSGIIINDQLFNGANCGAGEIGLLHYLDHNIEYYASGNLFRAKFGLSAEEAHRQALQGNVQAQMYWQEFGCHLAEALKAVVYAYDPEAIVLGGSLSKAYEFFEASMYAALQDFTFPESIRRLRIFQTQDENIPLLGAAALAKQNLRSSIKL